MGFVHRDIKPENILIAHSPEGLVAKISDFGLAKSFRGVGLSGLTFSGEMRGTVPFMPPEQMLDFKTVTPLADLYATAATLYYLLTCQYIYDEPAGGGDLIRMLLEEHPIPIRTRRADVPAAAGRGHREVPGPRPQGAVPGRHLDAAVLEAVLLEHSPDSLLAPRFRVRALRYAAAARTPELHRPCSRRTGSVLVGRGDRTAF